MGELGRPQATSSDDCQRKQAAACFVVKYRGVCGYWYAVRQTKSCWFAPSPMCVVVMEGTKDTNAENVVKMMCGAVSGEVF